MLLSLEQLTAEEEVIQERENKIRARRAEIEKIEIEKKVKSECMNAVHGID